MQAVGSAITGSPVMTGCEAVYWLADEAAFGFADPNSSINLISRVCHAAAVIAGSPLGFSAGGAALLVGGASMATEYLSGGWITLYPLANRLKVMAVNRLGHHSWGVICPVEANQALRAAGNSLLSAGVVSISQSLAPTAKNQLMIQN